jgi:hypothetical protein
MAAAATKGAISVIAYKKNTGGVWNTPIVLGANNGIEIEKESIATKVEMLENPQLAGRIDLPGADKGNEHESGDMVCHFKFETLETLIAMALGTAGAPAQVGADNAYKHTWKIKNDVFGIFGCLALGLQRNTYEYASFKMKGFKLDVDKSMQIAKLTFHLVASQLNINIGSGTNNNTTMASVTMKPGRQRALWQQVAVNLRPQDNTAFAATDAQLIEKFSIEVLRTFKEDDFTTSIPYIIDEPQDNGNLTVKGTFGFSRHDDGNNAMNRVTDMLSKAQNKCLISFVGPTVLGVGATNWSSSFYLNGLQIDNGKPNLPGPGLTPFTVAWEAHNVVAAPTLPANWPDNGAIGMIHVSSLNTDALA